MPLLLSNMRIALDSPVIQWVDHIPPSPLLLRNVCDRVVPLEQQRWHLYQMTVTSLSLLGALMLISAEGCIHSSLRLNIDKVKQRG